MGVRMYKGWRKIGILGVILGGVLVAGNAYGQADLGPIREIVRAHDPAFTGWPFYIDGNCVTLQSPQEVLCAYEDDSYGDPSAGGIFLIKSSDGGQTWGQPWRSTAI